MTYRQPPPSRELVTNVRTMNRRYKAHLERGNHILYEGSQQQVAHSTVDYFGEINAQTGFIHTDGYQVAPGGSGKTAIGGDLFIGINTMPNGHYVLGDLTLGKRVLVGVPTNQLAGQWGDALLGKFNEETEQRDPSIFGDRFNEDQVGVYHAELPHAEKLKVLSKPIVIAVHDSIQILHHNIDKKTGEPDPLVKPEDFDLVFIDETDDRVRGDQTREFYQEILFPHCMIIGCTATDRFRSGKTIGDYLYYGKEPICTIMHEDAVNRKELAPHVNIIVAPDIDLSSDIKPKTNKWDDYTDAEKLRFIEQTGTDTALLEAIKVGTHPKTGKPLREMMQLHQAVNIEHGKEIARQLNEAFGPNYAEAIWGGTDGEMEEMLRQIVRWEFGKGDLKAVVQCKLWGRGTDIPELELTVQHAPSLSPNKTIQFHTRASRKHDGNKIALYLSPYIRGIDQLVIGELLGGLYMIPSGYDFPPTTEQENPANERQPWPEIDGVEVYYTQEHLAMFAQERKHQLHIDELPVKNDNMLNLNEMADVLQIDHDILNERVFSGLQSAYEKRQARQEFIDLEEILHVRGRIFPVRRMGFHQHNGEEVFCLDANLTALCEHALYGRLDDTPAEVLDKDTAGRLLGCNQDQIDNLWRELQQAFFARQNYERSIEINGIDFSYDSFGFFRRYDSKTSEFFIFPDALIPAYSIINKVDLATAQQWASRPAIRQCKTSDWYSASDTLEALDLNLLTGNDEEVLLVTDLFEQLERKSRSAEIGKEAEVTINIGHTKQSIRCSERWLPMARGKQQTALVIHAASLECIKNELDTVRRNDKRPYVGIEQQNEHS